MRPAAGTRGVADRIRVTQGWIRPPLFLLVVCCLLIYGGGPGGAVCADGRPYHTVVRVYDGDTILVSGPDGRRVIRLLGIDAPETSKGKGETGQPYSKKSRQYLAGLILNRKVILVTFGKDRYERTLAVVYHDGRDINRAMIRAGLAEVYRGRTSEGFDKAPYRKTETQARQSKTGMWRQGADYISPIRWKHPR